VALSSHSAASLLAVLVVQARQIEWIRGRTDVTGFKKDPANLASFPATPNSE
jgi:hypothetical protein